MHQFGFEDWFFRSEWEIDGWRYAFLQGANLRGKQYLGVPMEVSLYTKLPDKRRCWVANVEGIERLTPQQSINAEALFLQHGWLGQMQHEVAAIGADAGIILNTPYAGHYLNVRYRPANVQMMPEYAPCPYSFWEGSTARYRFYSLPEN